MTNVRKVTFDLHLYDDASVKEKLTVMSPLDAAFDDARNIVPDEYYDIVNMEPGTTLRVTTEIVQAPSLASRVAELEKENRQLRAALSVASGFVNVRKCRSCDGYYPDGYVCSCGRDNSIPDDEWEERKR